MRRKDSRKTEMSKLPQHTGENLAQVVENAEIEKRKRIAKEKLSEFVRPYKRKLLKYATALITLLYFHFFYLLLGYYQYPYYPDFFRETPLWKILLLVFGSFMISLMSSIAFDELLENRFIKKLKTSFLEKHPEYAEILQKEKEK